MAQLLPPNETDQEHLRLLVIFHKVIACIYVVMGFCGLPHLIIGITGSTNPRAFVNSSQTNPPPDPFYWLFAVAGLAVIFGAWLFSILNLIASKKIDQRQSVAFIYIVAGLNCLWMPIGTALGVFTFVVVTRPSVRSLFPTT